MTTEFDSEKIQEKIKSFDDLLERLSHVDDKKKQLWLEIYENAIIDRANAHIMFVKLSNIAANSSNEHAIHGRTMATYIERMSKANEQLIKLSELLTKSEEPKDVNNITNDDIFKMIKKESK